MLLRKQYKNVRKMIAQCIVSHKVILHKQLFFVNFFLLKCFENKIVYTLQKNFKNLYKMQNWDF